MPGAPKLVDDVPIQRIFLSLDNPRHAQVDTEAKAIERLCAKENVFQLARDIVAHGLNPLERFALIPAAKSKVGSRVQNYFVAEGNRRICALRLLHDPDLAPANLRQSFEKLSTAGRTIKTVNAAVFDDQEDVRPWLDRIHSGPQGGIGRKDWNSEQKARFDGENKNRVAQMLLDYAQQKGMISEVDRVGKLTTVARFVSNDVFRETIGLDQSDPNELGRIRPENEFDILVGKFMKDVIGKTAVHSRMNKPDIIEYSRPLQAMKGISSSRIEAEPLVVGIQVRGGRRKTPRRPAKITHVVHEAAIAKALKSFGNQKLISLYHSLCSIELENHTPILSVGAWSFLETLTACAGRNEGTDFLSFLSKNKLATLGIAGETTSHRAAIERIKGYGNSTKHHTVSGAFNGDQLNNDIATLRDVILKCIEQAAAAKP
jgi:hypothetical protein